MSRLVEILNMVKHIPPFPKVAQRVMELIEDPNVDVADLAKVIQYDQSITANVLKICNSSYFSLGRKITSLDEGLIYIGHDVLKEIIITGSSSKFYKGKTGEGYQLEDGELWKHSVATGIMAKLLVKHIQGVDSGTAYTSALLHDIGKRFLGSFVADEAKEIMEKVDKEKMTFTAAEKQVLGVTHAELGGMILEKWEFPKEMVNAVKDHHEPKALKKDPLSAVTCLSNTLVISMGIGAGVSGLATEVEGEALKSFGISHGDMDRLMAVLMEEIGRAQDIIDL